MNTIKLLDFNLSTGSYPEFCETIIQLSEEEKNHYVCVANVHMFIEAYKDDSFSKIINNASVITPDGLPLSWSLKILYGINQERVAGMDLLPDLLGKASENKIPVFFYGCTDEILEKTKEYIKEYYPGIPSVGVYSPPFRELTKEEEKDIVSKINDSGAKLIFVSLGCPKQEKWMASMKGRINGVMLGIGGALPVLIGEQKRAPLWMQKTGMEWFYRFLQEPKRLFKRYLITNSTFILLILKEKFSTKKPAKKQL